MFPRIELLHNHPELLKKISELARKLLTLGGKNRLIRDVADARPR